MNTIFFSQAVSLNGQDLLGRAVKLDFARERGQYTPHDGYFSLFLPVFQTL